MHNPVPQSADKFGNPFSVAPTADSLNAPRPDMEPNVSINGAAMWHEDPLILTESVVRWYWPDGDVGYGMFERDYRLRMIPSPEPR
jgi:hypothetical protein